MKKTIKTVIIAVALAAFMTGCASMEYQSGTDKGEVHPGHVGHEKH